jgi:hypothetical protein
MAFLRAVLLERGIGSILRASCDPAQGRATGRGASGLEGGMTEAA